MPSILFIAAHRLQRSPSQRFRFEQYLQYFESQGFDWELSYLIPESHDADFYKPGNLRTKMEVFATSWWKRLQDVIRAREFDLIFVQREAFMTGSTRFERLFAKSGAKLIFDFDDAIWHLDVSEGNKKLGWLKRPGKTADIIGYSHHVIAGNNYLADYARQFNPNVTVIPTTIDTEYHRPHTLPEPKREQVCIGWTGSHTTVKHFRLAEHVLLRLKERYGEKIRFKLIGDPEYSNDALGLKGTPWTLADEVDKLRNIDIGIMPLPDDEWAKGKCGFKGLQYMAMEIPPVMSPVGVNTEIITHGENGFIAGNDEEWYATLCRLIEEPDLRSRIGKAARQTIIDRYSVESQKEVYLEVLNRAMGL